MWDPGHLPDEMSRAGSRKGVMKVLFVGTPVASFRCSCLVFPLYLIFTCYITRYLCVGQEEGRASHFFLLLTCTRYVLYNTFLPPLDSH